MQLEVLYTELRNNGMTHKEFLLLVEQTEKEFKSKKKFSDNLRERITKRVQRETATPEIITGGK